MRCYVFLVLALFRDCGYTRGLILLVIIGPLAPYGKPALWECDKGNLINLMPTLNKFFFGFISRTLILVVGFRIPIAIFCSTALASTGWVRSTIKPIE